LSFGESDKPGFPDYRSVCVNLLYGMRYKRPTSVIITLCLRKTVHISFLTEFRQISTNFDNFWQKDSKEAKIMRVAFIFHLT